MAQAPQYNRSKNFLENNSDRTDHGALNSELDNAAASINALRSSQAALQKDDGLLQSAIVSLANLTPAAIAGLQLPGPQGVPGPAGVSGPAGVAGPKGDTGASFNADVRDLIANRSQYNLQPKGFSFLALDTGLMYFKQTNASGDWSAGVQFGKGETGATGPAGPSGPQGSQGLQGIQGIQGVQGTSGTNGTNGAITTVDIATKTASLVGRTSVSARLVISGGQISIVLTTA